MAEEKKIPNLTIPILVGLLVIASFLLGSLWTRIRYGQPPIPQEQEQLAQVSPSPEGPAEGEVLGEQDRTKIEQGGAAIKGEEGTLITIVEFSEYQCPYCGRYFNDAYQQIWDEYGDKIRYIFHDYPLPFHPHAQKTSEAARCAGDQGQYWEMHDLLFEKQSEWSAEENIDSNLTNYTSQLGLDTTEFNDCLSSGKHTQAVKDDMSLGQSVGVSGTPTFFINGQKLVGAQPFTAFQAIIEKELKE